jgi:hypothetical protein
MTADAAPCDKPVAAAHRGGGSAALLGAGVNPMLALLASDDRSASRIAPSAATTDCTHKNQTPRTYDLHKIGNEPAPILLGAAGCSKTRGA